MPIYIPKFSCAFEGVAFEPKTNTLYVADTENHALRAIDLSTRVVTTLAGNGYQGRDYRGGGIRTEQQLSSPWDVELDAEVDSINRICITCIEI